MVVPCGLDGSLGGGCNDWSVDGRAVTSERWEDEVAFMTLAEEVAALRAYRTQQAVEASMIDQSTAQMAAAAEGLLCCQPRAYFAASRARFIGCC